jgi:glucokinase
MLGYGVGVDLGGTNLRVGAVDEEGKFLDRVSTPTMALGGRDGVIGRMCAEVTRIAERLTGAYALRGIGIAIPGIIDMTSGRVRESPNLPDWNGYPVRDEIERRLGTRVILENDANAAAMGEVWLGAAREHDSAVMLTLGTGVGGGIVLHRRLWHGFSGMAGEPGHATVDPGGVACPCGNRGCLEQYAGAPGIVRMAREAAGSGKAPSLARALEDNHEFSPLDLHNLAIAGDAAAQRIFETMGRALGIALATIINLLNVPVCVIGGGGSGAWNLFSPRMLEELEKRSYVYRGATGADGAPATQICRAALGDDSGLYGAARLPMLPGEVAEHAD